MHPLKLRYYLCGEYGDTTFRPHYHCVLFGFPTCVRGGTKRHFATGERLWEECCPQCRLVGHTWGRGLVELGTLSKDSASYVSNYVTKKMTAHDDFRLLGRFPEFARMSLRPGLAAGAMDEYAKEYMRYGLELSRVDVPAGMGHGRSVLPLGRYLRGKLRVACGQDAKAPQAALDQYEAEMLPLRLAARHDDNNPSFRSHVVTAGDGKRALLEARVGIYRKGRPL